METIISLFSGPYFVGYLLIVSGVTIGYILCGLLSSGRVSEIKEEMYKLFENEKAAIHKGYDKIIDERNDMQSKLYTELERAKAELESLKIKYEQK